MTSLWNQFDIDVDQILEATVRGDVDRKMQAMTTIIVSRGENPQHRDEYPEVTIQAGRRGGAHWPGTADVHPTKEDQEWQRCRRERARKRAAFFANPFKFTKELLGQKCSG